MTNVAVVLVTCNSTPGLTETLQSVSGQTQEPTTLIAIDDYSTDHTVQTLRAAGFTVQTSTSTSSDPFTRIAQNFVNGVRLAQQRGADIVVLGDHDDIWHRDRVQRQTDILETHRQVAMVASDGFLIDEHGVALPGSIRGSFPVPDDFHEWTLRHQMRFALRHSIATGGASAIRLSGLSDWTVPPGWLHDRWWSLVALRQQALLIDDTKVIDYRVGPDQQVGLATSGQDHPVAWWSARARHVGRTAGRVRDVAGLLRP